ncbi:MAG: SGNH/GDSL hydrolase family protein [Candidatus Omnitrophica bacterium]|nr:SGNH/GDSL hydrolase family protein [Candidatus Omnitrophota bacterium]
MNSRIFQNILLLAACCVIGVLTFECVSFFFIKQSPRSYGLFLKRDLPPFKIKLLDNPNAEDDKAINDVVVNNQKITWGDLRGVAREDEILGYAPMENRVSRNGWWQSNNLGATSREDTEAKTPPGKKRVIIFGESFANCWGVPLEESWPFFMNKKSGKWEIVNFAVSGYSMGQCLLRFENIKQKLDYDKVILAFVPSVDLWRDVNVLRQLRGWAKGPVMPRFIVDHDQLKLVQSPYKTWRDALEDNASGISETLKRHLQAYDRFYSSSQYESPPGIGALVSYKLLASVIHDFKEKLLLRNMGRPGSEARAVTQRIIERMNNETKRAGKEFILVYIPTKEDIGYYKNNRAFARQYDEMVLSTSRLGITAIDLMKDLVKADPLQMDCSYDGSHYGPKANKMIAELLWRYFLL